MSDPPHWRIQVFFSVIHPQRPQQSTQLTICIRFTSPLISCLVSCHVSMIWRYAHLKYIKLILNITKIQRLCFTLYGVWHWQRMGWVTSLGSGSGQTGTTSCVGRCHPATSHATCKSSKVFSINFNWMTMHEQGFIKILAFNKARLRLIRNTKALSPE